MSPFIGLQLLGGTCRAKFIDPVSYHPLVRVSDAGDKTVEARMRTCLRGNAGVDRLRISQWPTSGRHLLAGGTVHWRDRCVRRSSGLLLGLPPRVAAVIRFVIVSYNFKINECIGFLKVIYLPAAFPNVP